MPQIAIDGMLSYVVLVEIVIKKYPSICVSRAPSNEYEKLVTSAKKTWFSDLRFSFPPFLVIVESTLCGLSNCPKASDDQSRTST